MAPLVQLAAERIGFELEQAKLAGSKKAVAARRGDVRDGAVDDSGLGGTTNLREVGEQTGKVEEASVEGLATLALDGIVSGTTLSSVGAARRLALFVLGSRGHLRGDRSLGRQRLVGAGGGVGAGV